MNTEGLRIYDAFFQHRSSDQIPHDPNLPYESASTEQQGRNAIRRHHRYEAKQVKLFHTSSVD